MGRHSLITAGLVAPAAGALWAATALTIAFAVSSGVYWSPDVAVALLGTTFVYAGLVCLVLTWTIGLGWHVAARRLRWTSFAAYVAAGTLMGFAISLPLALLVPSSPPTGAFIFVYLPSCAVVVSATGWLIRRPDRDTPNPPTPRP